MSIRNLLALFAVAACAHNSDPRPSSISRVSRTRVSRDGHGSWIVVTPRVGAPIAGELIAVDPRAVRVLTRSGLVSIEKTAISTARLSTRETERDLAVPWDVAGILSVRSHHYWLPFSAPVRTVTGSIAASAASGSSSLAYSGDGWDRLSPWARFPQGMPPVVTDPDLRDPDRPPPLEPAPGSAGGGAPLPP